MNKRQKKKFEKKLRLKRYDTLSRLHKQNKMRLWCNGEYVTAVMAVLGRPTLNHRVYPASVLRNVFNDIGDIIGEVGNEHPTFGCRSIVEGE